VTCTGKVVDFVMDQSDALIRARQVTIEFTSPAQSNSVSVRLRFEVNATVKIHYVTAGGDKATDDRTFAVFIESVFFAGGFPLMPGDTGDTRLFQHDLVVSKEQVGAAFASAAKEQYEATFPTRVVTGVTGSIPSAERKFTVEGTITCDGMPTVDLTSKTEDFILDKIDLPVK
jgi:hypothetical protein